MVYFTSLSKIYWKLCRKCSPRPWRPRVPWVLHFRLPLSWCPQLVVECLSFKHNSQLLEWEPWNHERNPVKGHLLRLEGRQIYDKIYASALFLWPHSLYVIWFSVVERREFKEMDKMFLFYVDFSILLHYFLHDSPLPCF